MNRAIEQKTGEFVGEIERLVFEETKQRVAAAVAALPLQNFVAPDLGSLQIKLPSLSAVDKAPNKKSAPSAKKAKRIVKANMIQWQCPVPKCKGKAAPVFGMVCSEHKDLPKAQIKKYRAARQAAKAKAGA